MPTPLDIDPDPLVARTPPRELYVDPALRARLRQRLVHGWHQLWEADEPGEANLVPARIAGEPVLWVGGEPERLLSNVCTHRAATLVDGPCTARAIRCPYHGRRFDLDGRFVAAPGFDADPGPDASLPRAEVRRVGPLRFGSYAPEIPFEDWWAPVRERTAAVGFDWEALRRDPAGDRLHTIEAPWLLYLENYLEGFHVPFVHKELQRVLDPRDYRHELLPHGTLQVGVAPADDPGAPAFVPTTGPDAGTRVAAWWFWLWPTTLVNVYPWGVSLNLIEDVAHGRCTVRYRAWVLDDASRGRGAGGALDLVEEQDQEVVLRAWAGVQAATLFRRGRYAPAHERGLHHFHRLLDRALT
ncbi:MAG: Rieske 2Fe-2S domain-containing protein [Alphaproteobacteria bacterium]|nr:Rieske 2Fe-2S domain-containing protein [Alphaproteobacteria bacterium]MCB9696059.1 Rieske 2Fe-2S domain-containing protein [Alphaproteobacteria bacterium]